LGPKICVTITDMSNVAYVIIKESFNIRILNGFLLDPIVIQASL
jgi:hypothetical protein